MEDKYNILQTLTKSLVSVCSIIPEGMIEFKVLSYPQDFLVFTEPIQLLKQLVSAFTFQTCCAV